MSKTSRVILPDRSLKSGTRHRIDAALRHRLVDVLRLRVGDGIVVVDREGRTFSARLVTERRFWALEILDLRPDEHAVRDSISIRLILGLLKSDRTEWAIQKVTEMGVSEIRVALCERCVPRPALFESGRRLARMRRVAGEAARQCHRASVPEVSLHPDLSSALRGWSPLGVHFFMDEAMTAPSLASVLAGTSAGDVTLAIGPEGSFSPAERETLITSGFTPAGLGPRVLRAETAAVVAVTVVQVLLGDLSGMTAPSRE